MGNDEKLLRNRTVDVLKGISIIFVIITHYSWTKEQRSFPVFPYLIDMAIPIFMIISGFTWTQSYSRHRVSTFSEAYKTKNVVKKIFRFSIPYVFVVLYQIYNPNIEVGTGILGSIRWVLNGTVGQGSYYYPLLMQLVFFFPIIYFIVESKKKKGLWLCLGINVAYEILQWSYGLNNECYRLLLFRYTFVIAVGVFASKNEFSRFDFIVFTVLGALFITITQYGLYTPRIISKWTSTCFIASMWIVPVVVLTIKRTNIHCKLLEIIGKASYNIFFVQMVYYAVYMERLSKYIDLLWVEILLSCVLCCLVGIVFFQIESRITRGLLKKLSLE